MNATRKLPIKLPTRLPLLMSSARLFVAVTAALMSLTSVSTVQAEPAWKLRKEISGTVQTFYTNYLSAVKRPKERNLILHKHLTSELYLSIQNTFEEQDVDPVIKSEYIGSDYRKKIHVYNVRLDDAGIARADVRLGELPQGVKSPGGPLNLRLKLQRVENRWKIAGVERGFDN